jgi:hypothetical protein
VLGLAFDVGRKIDQRNLADGSDFGDDLLHFGQNSQRADVFIEGTFEGGAGLVKAAEIIEIQPALVV